MAKPKAHDRFDYRERDVGDLNEFSPSLTKQADMKEADVNFIMKKYEKTGLLPTIQGVPQYGDFSQVTNYHEAILQIQEAHEAFEALPAKLRLRFGNDPGEFVEWIDNPANQQEAIKLGLIAGELEESAPAPASAEAGKAGTP